MSEKIGTFDDVSCGRTVQFYIDEKPYWADGTEAPSPKMTGMQWRIWWLSVAGKFFEGLVVFMTGVALPLIAKEFDLNAAQHGIVGSASLFGILIGASALGGLSDRFGRKRVFIFELGLFIAFLAAIIVTPSFLWLAVCLFGMGLALGCDYPTAHLVISESTPSHTRGGLVLSAFGFQAVGAIFGTILGYIILTLDPSIQAWRWMYASAIIPALIVFVGRFFIPESPHWLAARGREREAEDELEKLLSRVPAYPTEVKIDDLQEVASKKKPKTGYAALFHRENRRALILASVPWFLQDLGTYGIGIFTPTILAATVGHQRENAHNIADLISNDLIAAKGTALLDILLLVGVVAAVFLADKLGRIRLQVFGFIGCALGLSIAAQSSLFDGPMQTALIFAGFMLFNFMTNLGPNAQTYLIAGEVFPTRIRGTGAGFAASFAKIGACLTAFLFPILLSDIGTTILLYILVGTSLLGALITFFYRIETKGISLEAE
ncbi:MFS transporter [Martelella mediterranea]|uniref:Sugar transport protein n=1 Tax=Martelella mediterranea TaxID=293089 RepID=A0A4R3NSU6_9HYPH|nr:MFS transporter [Martelella mediterranea]TCT40311.1 sugar transport protein [Martelella mediterranea]